MEECLRGLWDFLWGIAALRDTSTGLTLFDFSHSVAIWLGRLETRVATSVPSLLFKISSIVLLVVIQT